MVGLILLYLKSNLWSVIYLELKKKKLLISLIILISGVSFNIYFSTIIHFLLTKKMVTIEIPNLKTCIQSITVSKQHLLFFYVLMDLQFYFLYFTL